MDYERGSVGWMLKSFSSIALAKILSKISGEKDVTSNSLKPQLLDLVVSPQLIKFLDSILSYAALKESGVDKIYRLEDGISNEVSSRRCYLVSNDPSFTRIIANHLNARKDITCYIIYVPRILKICEMILEEQGVYGHATIMELPLSFVPLDSDLFSLEQGDFFELYFLRNNYHVVHNIAIAISQLRQIFGSISSIIGIGKCSKMAIKLFDSLEFDPPTSSSLCIDHLILFDRDIDYLSLFLSPTNYQSLLDEKFKISCSKIKIPESIMTREGLTSNVFYLQSHDIVFKHIRDLHFIDASNRLRNLTKGFAADLERNKNMTLEEMEDFVQNELSLKKQSQRSLKLHISLFEVIMSEKREIDFRRVLDIERLIIEREGYNECLEFIEDAIIRQLCPKVCLRLLCLFSLLNDGIPPQQYDRLATLFFQSFGHSYMLNFHNFSKLGVLIKQNRPKIFNSSKVSNVLSSKNVAKVIAGLSKSHLNSVIKGFNQISKNINELNKTKEADFLFGAGYVPLINRIVELVINDENNFKDSINAITSHNIHRVLSSKEQRTQKIVVVLAVGGLSYAEISALRYLADRENINLIICTTSITSGDRLISQLGVNETETKN